MAITSLGTLAWLLPGNMLGGRGADIIKCLYLHETFFWVLHIKHFSYFVLKVEKTPKFALLIYGMPPKQLSFFEALP